jgi:hypothetical protein
MGPPNECTKDSQCVSGNSGRCVESGGGVLFCACTYDTCQHDTDCPANELCACHGSPYTFNQGNTCKPGNCRVDADCGAGGYCSPSYQTMSCGSLEGYFCHTPNDQCIDDTDCPSSQGPAVCVYSSTNSRWECHQEALCG